LNSCVNHKQTLYLTMTFLKALSFGLIGYRLQGQNYLTPNQNQLFWHITLLLKEWLEINSVTWTHDNLWLDADVKIFYTGSESIKLFRKEMKYKLYF